MRYADMPIPPRRAGAPGPGAPGKPVPKGFVCALTLSGDRLVLSASLAGTAAVYRGRGYFTESPSDPAGAGFRVPQLSLLDPFLWQYRTVAAQHFQIVLRAIVPKLQRDGVPLTCGLTLTDEAPLQLDTARIGGGFRFRLTCAVPRAALTPLRGCDGYMLAETTLYRIRPDALEALEPYPDGEFDLTDAAALPLARLCERDPRLFAGSGVAALHSLTRSRPAPRDPLRDPVLSRLAARRAPLEADLGPRPAPGFGQSDFRDFDLGPTTPGRTPQTDFRAASDRAQTPEGGTSRAPDNRSPYSPTGEAAADSRLARAAETLSGLREKAEAALRQADELLFRREAARAGDRVSIDTGADAPELSELFPWLKTDPRPYPARDIPPRRSDGVQWPAQSRREIPLEGPALVRAAVLPSPRYGAVRSAVFLTDARRLRDYTVERAEFVGFRAGRPTYADMTPAQRAWYFHWRGAFRQGIVLQTDISYIYVAAYELLNSVTASGAEALSTLLRLWESYRKAFPYLDRCMPGWCVDYMLTRDLGTDFDAISERIPFDIGNTDLPPELFCNRRLRDGLASLPLPLLGALSGYPLAKSKFFGDPGQAEAAAPALQRALAAAEEACVREKGKTLLALQAPMQTASLHDCFWGAVTGRAAAARVELVWRPYSRDPAFQAFLSALLRHIENRLRRRAHFPGRLKADPLPDWAEAALDAALSDAEPEASAAAPAAPRAPIVIDLARARALEDASWENTRRLLDALGETDAVPAADPAPAAPVGTPDASSAPAAATESASVPEIGAGSDPESAPASETRVESASQPAPVPQTGPVSALQSPTMPESMPDSPAAPSRTAEPALEPEPEALPFRARLTVLQRQVLDALLAGDAAQVSSLCAAAMTFPDAVYEEINEIALEALGDILIDTAEGAVYEEYREVIE